MIVEGMVVAVSLRVTVQFIARFMLQCWMVSRINAEVSWASFLQQECGRGELGVQGEQMFT